MKLSHSIIQRNEKTCFKCLGLGHIASVCTNKKGSWEKYKLYLKDKFGMGPEFIGKTKDVKTEESTDFSSKAVEEPVDETQTMDEIQIVHRTNNESKKEATENPTTTYPAIQSKMARDQLAMKKSKSSKNQKASSEIIRVSTRKRIPHEKLRN